MRHKDRKAVDKFKRTKFGHDLWHALKYKEGQLYHIYSIIMCMAEVKQADINGKS